MVIDSPVLTPVRIPFFIDEMLRQWRHPAFVTTGYADCVARDSCLDSVVQVTVENFALLVDVLLFVQFAPVMS